MPRLPRSGWRAAVKFLIVPGTDALPTVTCGPAAAPAGRPPASRPVSAAARPRRRAVEDFTAAPEAVGVLPLSPRSSLFLLAQPRCQPAGFAFWGYGVSPRASISTY